MVDIVYRQTSKDKPFVICWEFVYYRKAAKKNSVRYTSRDCDARLTVENLTVRILKVNGKNVRNYETFKDEIQASHEDCEKMDEEKLLAFDTVNR